MRRRSSGSSKGLRAMAEVMYPMMSDAGLWRRAFQTLAHLRGYTYSGLRVGVRDDLFDDLAGCMKELHSRGRQTSMFSYCQRCGEPID